MAEDAGTDPDQAALGAVDLPREQYFSCLRRLHDDGYLYVRFNRGDSRVLAAHVVKALPKALRELGRWPKAASRLEQKKVDRANFLERLYELTDGNPFCVRHATELAAAFHWTEEHTLDVAQYLLNEGLLIFRGMGGALSITHKGVLEMEQAIENPYAPTNHFPALNIVNIYGSVTDSQVQAGTLGSNQAQEGRSGD